MKYRDYYQILGVPRGASEKEIRDAFRKLARQFHPDRHEQGSKEQKAAEERFKEITEAHEVLGDPEKRKRYDTLGSGYADGSDFTPPDGFDFSSFFGGAGAGAGGRARRPRGGASGMGGFSDFFRTVFGGAGGDPFGFGGQAGGFAGQAGPGGAGGFSGGEGFRGAERAPDTEGTLELELLEAYRGGKRSVNLGSATGGMRTVELNVPAGVRDGARLRLRGQGRPAQPGAPAGDLLLKVKIREDGAFKLQGDDVVTEVKVWPWEVVLGTRIEVPTFDGRAELRIPAGSTGDGRLRLRGQGWPRPGGQRGDLFVVLRIVVPAEANQRERELYEELAALRRDRP
ncbi:MAG: J domain-containing protein [Planctomycetes bacterium]|nr:J domain-containing protein [Planctomycetota bacterium]